MTEVEDFLSQISPAQLSRDGQIQPWLPQPDETAQEYLAFSLWRDIGPGRQPQTNRLAKHWSWKERAEAFDRWIEVQPPDIQATANQVAGMLIESMPILVQALRQELVKHAVQVASTSHAGISLPELVKCIKTVAEVTRLLSGQSTVTLGVEKLNLANLSTEELVQLESLQNKALV
jgi:hypothetical protein